MARTLSSTLTAEMESLHRRHASTATVERWLPEWNPIISGLSGSKYEQYAHGHAACVAPNANGTGEDVLFRARSGSWSNPRDGYLYIQVLKGSDLDDPATWESKWISPNLNLLMHPAWTANDFVYHGGSIAAVWNSSTSRFRVFFVITSQTTRLQYADFDLAGNLVENRNIGSNLGTTSYQMASVQLASCHPNEVFLAKIGKLEDPTPTAGWQKPVFGTMIYRYWGDGTSWTLYDSFPFYTHAECGLCRDSQFAYGGAGTGWDPNAWGHTNEQAAPGASGAAGYVTAQWGKRPCGGLAANQIDSNTVVVSAGFTFWRRYGLTTHNQGVLSFLFYRDSNLWERNFEAGLSDYVAERLDFDMFVRGSRVGNNNFLVWSRLSEPSDFDQLDIKQALPRTREVVYAKINADGKAITQYQYLGPQDDLTSAALVTVTHAGTTYHYALGWRAVYQSGQAAFLMGQTTESTGLDTHANGWKTSVNNRWGMSVDFNVEDAGALFEPATLLKAGSLVRVYAGTPEEQIQIAQGLIDTINPVLNLQQESHRAKIVARAEKGLLDPRAEEMVDILPQQTLYIQPADPIKNISIHNGYWDVQPMEWPNLYFSGQYTHLQLANAYRLLSFPYANTGGDQGPGYPGMVLDQRPQHKGTWFNDLAWVGLSPMVDGMIQASIRFGDTKGLGNFDFWARDGNHVYATVNRQNGITMGIHWRTGGYGGPVWNPPVATPWGVAQYALMGGIVCHAAEIGKKYAFVWECDSYFGGYNQGVYTGSSHTDDTWRKERFDRADYSAHGVGANRLYLIESDYDETDELWEKNSRWIHKSVAGGVVAAGLTPGRPADLKMVVLGGTIYCFYRPHRYYNQTPAQWRYAFQYEAARFGAGRFGVVGRGHAGIQWDDLFYAKPGSSKTTGRDLIPRYDNYVDFWDVHASDAVKDRSLEEILHRHCWQGFTPTTFKSTVNQPGPINLVSGATSVCVSPDPPNLPAPVENLTIDFKVKLTYTGNEAGVILRAVSTTLTNDIHLRIGIVAGGGLPGAAGTVATYAVKRYYGAGGAYDSKEVEYSPFPLNVPVGVPIPVRITSRGNVYTVWIAGNYAGHFLDDAEAGLYFGLYAAGTNQGGYAAQFTNVRVPELYEVPEISSIEVNQTMFDAIKKLLGKRAIKGVFQPDGAVKISYFETHDSGPSFMDSLKQSALRISDRFASIVRVDGAYTFAVYASEVLLKWGRRFIQESLPDIFHHEFCYKEAKNICTRLAEDQVQTTFVGLPDLRVQPEDKIEVIVSRQNIAGHYLVDDVSIDYQAGDDPSLDSTISTRRFVVI